MFKISIRPNVLEFKFQFRIIFQLSAERIRVNLYIYPWEYWPSLRADQEPRQQLEFLLRPLEPQGSRRFQVSPERRIQNYR